jgi:hypothetical protein
VCLLRGTDWVFKYTFCPHSVFMCFVWISEQTAIISLYSINWPLFITETECVYCAVRAEYLNINGMNLDCSAATVSCEESIKLSRETCLWAECALLMMALLRVAIDRVLLPRALPTLLLSKRTKIIRCNEVLDCREQCHGACSYEVLPWRWEQYIPPKR